MKFFLISVVVGGVLLSGCVSQTTSTRSGNNLGDGPAANEDTSPARRAAVRMELASAYFSRGQYDTALDEVKRAISADPNASPAYNLRGLIYGALNDAALAEESFRKALQISPHDGDTMHNFGWFLCKRGRYADAAPYFASAVEQPQYRGMARTWLARGVCEARAGKNEQAQVSLKRAYELEPGNPAIAINFSQLLYQRGEYERARFYIRRVNAVAEQVSAESLWLAARIEMKLGQVGRANELGQQLRERFPQSREASLFDRTAFDE